MWKKYDYYAAMLADLQDFLTIEEITDKSEEDLFEAVWAEDYVTGNGGEFYNTE